jgi:tetratricopeptide (TPR) repeat protein
MKVIADSHRLRLTTFVFLLCSLFACSVYAQVTVNTPDNKVSQSSDGEILKLATQSLQNKDFADVILQTSKLIEKNPKSGDIYFMRGMAYYSIKQQDAAINDLTKAIYNGMNEESMLMAYRMRALSFYAKKNYEESIRDLTSIITKDATNFRDFMFRSWAYFYSGNSKASLKDVNQVINLNPGESGIRGFRAKVYLSLGEFEKAINDSSTELLTSPSSLSQYKVRAEAYRKLGKLELAEADEKKFAELGGDKTTKLSIIDTTPELTKKLLSARKLFEDGKQTESIQQLDELLKVVPKDDSGLYAVYYLKGRCLIQKDELDKAIESLSESIKLTPKFLAGYVMRGQAYLTKGQFDLSLTDFNKAAEVNPNDKILLRYCTRLFRGLVLSRYVRIRKREFTESLSRCFRIHQEPAN